MVAGSKLRLAEEELRRFRPYAQKQQEMLRRVARDAPAGAHPLLDQRPARRQTVLVICSERGLCGGFNNNVMERLLELLGHARPDSDQETCIHLIGRKGIDLLKRQGLKAETTYPMLDIPKRDDDSVANAFIEAYTARETDACWIVFNRFVSRVQEEVVARMVLPLLPLADGLVPNDEDAPAPEPALPSPGQAIGPSESRATRPLREYIFEPDRGTMLDLLLPLYVRSQVLWALLESEAAEQEVRMTAMQAATNNAQEMIDRLTLEYNRARQGAITQELMEIVAGAEALS